LFEEDIQHHREHKADREHREFVDTASHHEGV
jgi:hypothetical protein